MNYRLIKIVGLTILALALIPATAGANGSHSHNKHDEKDNHHIEKNHDEDHGYRGGRLTRLKKKLSESSCNSIEGRGRGLCYAYCEVLDCDTEANQGRRICQGLSRRYQRITRTAEAPPCTVVAQPTSQPASCPCFGDLSEAGFTDAATCANITGIAQVSEFNGTFLIAEAGATDTFSGCGLNGTYQLSIPMDEATGCVTTIEQFCQALP